MRNLILPFILLLTFVFSCRENDNIAEILEKKNTSYDVYVAGTENNEACYWKNTLKTVLPNGTGYDPYQIFLNNNDIYVFAYYQNPITHEVNYYYWKNNIKYDIAQYLGIQPNTAISQNFTISNFFVENGNVYIAGLMRNPAATSTQNQYQYCYWKNGIKTVVFEQNDYTTSASIYLIGNDVYVPLENNIINTPTTNWDLGYYKNGVYHFVSTFSNCLDIHEEGGSLKMLIKDNTNQTVYYKDLSTGIITPSPSFISFNNSYYHLQIDGINRYFIGTVDYYKNNIQYNLYPMGSNFKYLNSFKALDNNIYKILHTDDNTGVNYKVFVNDVEVQSTANPIGTTNTEFTSLTVIPN